MLLQLTKIHNFQINGTTNKEHNMINVRMRYSESKLSSIFFTLKNNITTQRSSGMITVLLD